MKRQVNLFEFLNKNPKKVGKFVAIAINNWGFNGNVRKYFFLSYPCLETTAGVNVSRT